MFDGEQWLLKITINPAVISCKKSILFFKSSLCLYGPPIISALLAVVIGPSLRFDREMHGSLSSKQLPIAGADTIKKLEKRIYKNNRGGKKMEALLRYLDTKR